jgi:DnaJ family protein A protein 2
MKKNALNTINSGDENFQNATNGGGGGFPGGMNPNDLFAQMFAGMGGFPGGNGHFEMNFGHKQARNHHKRNDHSHGIHISLNESYTGIHKTIQINLQKICVSCQDTCNNCQGRGQITNMVRNGIFTQIINQPCSVCKGSGSIVKGKDNCKECNGKGQYTDEKRIDIDIPPGTTSSSNTPFINIKGMGEQKLNKDDIPGDLLLYIQVNDHPYFSREGHNLIYMKDITFKESIVGKKFIIDHFSGQIEVNTIDFGIIESNKKYEIHGKGMPVKGNKTQYGNLIIKFNIMYPSVKLSAEDVSTFEKAFKTINL